MMLSTRRGVLKGALGAFALAALPRAATASLMPFGPWQAGKLRDHPLVGCMCETASERPLSRRQVEERVRQSSIVVLGETHDNPDHHRIQAALLRAFAQGRARPPAVVFEMIDRKLQSRLDALMKLPQLDADMIFDAVRWDSSGWPDRALYRPVMEVVAELRLPMLAAGVPQKQVRAAARKGLAALLPAQELERLKLAPLPEEAMQALVKEVIRSHCDMIPQEVAQRMTAVQRLRDALLADRAALGFRRQGAAAIITGTGHARKDRAVPFYLTRHEGMPPALVVWPAEVRKEAKTLADVMPRDARPAEVADIAIITPRAQRKDPCEQFERFMKRKNQRQQ